MLILFKYTKFFVTINTTPKLKFYLLVAVTAVVLFTFTFTFSTPEAAKCQEHLTEQLETIVKVVRCCLSARRGRV